MKRKEMTIAEIYDALQKSAKPRDQILYIERTKKLICTACGMSSMSVVTIKHRKDCLYNLFYKVVYEIKKHCERSTDVRLQKALKGQKQ